MAIHSIHNIQKIPIPLQQAWDFYGDPANLQRITPSFMQFEILSISQRDGERLFAGQEMEYYVRPLFGIRLRWKTLISKVEAPFYFVDEQAKGPYKSWKHEHIFREIDGGVEMTDRIHYENPLGPLGELAQSLLVKRKLREIFEFRFNRVVELFGEWPGGQAMSIEIQ